MSAPGDRRHLKVCTSNDWSSGGLSGDGIPSGMVQAGYFRTTPAFWPLHPRGELFVRLKFRRGELDGKLYPIDGEARTAEGLLHGYLHRYFSKQFWTREQWAEWLATRSERRRACCCWERFMDWARARGWILGNPPDARASADGGG